MTASQPNALRKSINFTYLSAEVDYATRRITITTNGGQTLELGFEHFAELQAIMAFAGHQAPNGNMANTPSVRR